jgi:hypothetical protein
MSIIVTGTIEVKDSNDKISIVDASDMYFDQITTERKTEGIYKTHIENYNYGHFIVIASVVEFPKGKYYSYKIEIENGELLKDNLRIEFDEDYDNEDDVSDEKEKYF